MGIGTAHADSKNSFLDLHGKRYVAAMASLEKVDA